MVVGKLVDSACVNSYNCKLTFSCNSGYKFDSGRTNEIAFCQGNGKWSILKPECQRKFIMNFRQIEILKHGPLPHSVAVIFTSTIAT